MLRNAAKAALESKKAAKEQERAQSRTAMVAQARALFDTVMRTPDDKLPVKAADLDVPHTDLDAGLVVLTDGDVAVVIQSGQIHRARYDGGWVVVRRPLGSLADLGEVLR